MEWVFPAVVEDIVDGDTYDLRIDVGFATTRRVRVRLLGSKGGVNTPEMHGVTTNAGLDAKLRVIALMPIGTAIQVRTVQYKQDGFHRYLAQVILPDGRDLGDLLLAEKLATVWTPG